MGQIDLGAPSLTAHRRSAVLNFGADAAIEDDVPAGFQLLRNLPAHPRPLRRPFGLKRPAFLVNAIPPMAGKET
jgi:hypothetical protein